MGVSVKRTEFSDFEELQGIAPDGRSEVVPLGSGRMSGSLTHISVNPSFGVSRGTLSQGVRLLGVTSQNRWMFAMLLATNGVGAAVQQEIAVGDLLIVPPGEERYSVYQKGYSFAAALVAPGELNAFLATQPGVLDLPWQQPARVHRVDPETAANNIRQLSILSAALAEHGPTLPEQTVDFYQRNVLELVTAPIRDDRHQGMRIRSPVVLVQEVDRFIVEAGNRPIHVSELSERFKVPRRSLFRAFDEVTGMPPISFLRRKRLGDVHSALLRAGPDVLVRDIAIAHGFLDQGKFAREYRRHFGERPRETARRSHP